jgi:hypothetical protein
MANESQRDAVCDKYDVYFKRMQSFDKAFKDELDRLYSILKEFGKLELFCWCAPKRCHAETIKEYLERREL